MPNPYRDLVGHGDDSRIVEQLAHHAARLAARLASVRHVIAVMSGKGGVGKSSLTAILAAALTIQGKRGCCLISSNGRVRRGRCWCARNVRRISSASPNKRAWAV